MSAHPSRSAVLAIALCAAIEAAHAFTGPFFPHRISKDTVSASMHLQGSGGRIALGTPLKASARKAAINAGPSMLLEDRRPEMGDGGGPEQLIKDFVTQRTLQTVLSNLDYAHQEDHRNFLQNFLDHSGIQEFHGYGGLKVGWMKYLTTLRKTAQFDIIRRKAIRKGGSPDNPYIKQEYFEYSVTIEPSRLCDDLCEVRVQIAEEWQADLQLISAENAEQFRHHNAVVVNNTDTEAKFNHPLIHSSDGDSPLRKANYDLLEKYVTHVAAGRVLFEMSRSKAERHSHSWLKDFMTMKGEGFEGDHGFNVGRSFLKALLAAPPSLVPGRKGEKMSIIDPLDIAARIMAERQCVADMWVETLEGVEEDHLAMNRKVLQECFEANMINVSLDD